MQKEQMKKLLFSFLPEIHEKNLIHEFPAGEDSMAIGISLENIDEERNVFVYNIFCGDEYINILTEEMASFCLKHGFEPNTNTCIRRKGTHVLKEYLSGDYELSLDNKN